MKTKKLTVKQRRAAKLGLKPAIRLNGTSDLPWENLASDLFKKFSHVQFYDYTKSFKRAIAYAKGELPQNYHLTFSLAENNATLANLALDAGVNVAAVVSGLKSKTIVLPTSTVARDVFDADLNDLRFTDVPGRDGRGRVGILTAKGKAKNDASGFVLKLSA